MQPSQPPNPLHMSPTEILTGLKNLIRYGFGHALVASQYNNPEAPTDLRRAFGHMAKLPPASVLPAFRSLFTESEWTGAMEGMTEEEITRWLRVFHRELQEVIAKHGTA